jgi:Domain of unknown function (DUF4287)
MSFQAYLDNIQAKTGKSPDDFRKLAEAKHFTKQGKLREGVKAGDIVKWLKADFELGHGHAMAICAMLKGLPEVSQGSKRSAKPSNTGRKK